MGKLRVRKGISLHATKRKRFPKFKPGMKIDFRINRETLNTQSGYLWDHAPDGCWWVVTPEREAIRVRCINTSHGSYWRAV